MYLLSRAIAESLFRFMPAAVSADFVRFHRQPIASLANLAAYEYADSPGLVGPGHIKTLQDFPESLSLFEIHHAEFSGLCLHNISEFSPAYLREKKTLHC